MSRGELYEYNPWWTNPQAINQDVSVNDWNIARFKWRPRLGETFQWDVDVIYVLRGPRQVGKTTLIKLKIKELIDRGIQPRSIFYWACDLVEKPERLVEIINGYLAFSRDIEGRRYIFLDEISSVKDWQKGIKSLHDKGKLRNCTVVLTGSHSIDLRRATESLARRRGDVHKLKDKLPDKILLPMKFSEYAESRSPEIKRLVSEQNFIKRDRRHQLLSELFNGNLPKEIEEAQLLSKELNELYQEYLITGGIPRSINAYISDGTITRDIYEGYVELLLKDIRKWEGNEAFIRQIIKRLVETLSSPVGFNALREDTEIASHNTVSVYVNFLRDNFVISMVCELDRNRDAPAFRKEKKFHFEDPFIFHALRSWALGREPYDETLQYLKKQEELGKITESVVANHLIRLLFSYFPSTQFDYTTLLFYWRSQKKRELDFVLRMSNLYVPIEVKYQSKISSENGFSIIDFQKGGKSSKGLLLTKDSLEAKRSYIEVPVPIFLLLI
ncbi:MAG: ATP-binding protein [Thermoproteota archaeon]|nr:ATP-binding protein [Candidatus Bathyarchaeota archaeon]